MNAVFFIVYTMYRFFYLVTLTVNIRNIIFYNVFVADSRV